VLAAAPRIAEVRAVATINAPFDPAHVLKNFGDARLEIETAGEAEVNLAGRPFRIKKQFIEDIESHHLTASLAKMKKALLVMHAPLDNTVGVDNASQIFLAAKHPKSFVALDGADHLLTRKEDAIYAGSILAAWAAHYVSVPAAQDKPLIAAAGEVIVAETGTGNYALAVAAGKHRLRADEPESAGGSDTGPAPYELLMAALGACTSITLRMYADRRQFPLSRVAVKLTQPRAHADDCANCEKPDSKMNSIDREITLEGELDEGQRQKLLEIAGKCPIHRIVEPSIRITTRLV
jgi:uncharacterized OsmC-like protein